MLSRTQLRQFLAVVDTGSFTRAAASLNIAQPSLSAGIAELERQLGTRLFVRERRRIGLTPAGNELLPLARGIERSFHRAETQVGNLPVPLRPIRLGVLETLPLHWLEAIVTHYRGPEPLELVEGSARELQAALGSESLDLALTIHCVGKIDRYTEYCRDFIVVVDDRHESRFEPEGEPAAMSNPIPNMDLFAETAHAPGPHEPFAVFLVDDVEQ